MNCLSKNYDNKNSVLHIGLDFNVDPMSAVVCVIENDRVKVPNCLHIPYQKAYELGWSSIRDPQDFGGMGAPSLLAYIFSTLFLILTSIPIAFFPSKIIFSTKDSVNTLRFFLFFAGFK